MDRSKEFVFLTFPTYWQPRIYIDESNTWHIFAAQDSKVRIYDEGDKLVQELDVAKLSMARTAVLDPWKVYRIASTGNIMVYGTTLNSMIYLPSLTGGYVGKSFLAVRGGSSYSGDLQSFLAVAMEDAKISFYDMRKPAGSSPDKVLNPKRSEMAFDTYFQANVPVMVKSTGNTTLLVGGNCQGWGSSWTSDPGYVIPQYVAEDMALLGARAGQEIGFYAPYQAIIFAAGDTDVEINGIPRGLKRDEFVRVASGTFTIKPSSASVIVEVLGNVDVYLTNFHVGGKTATAYLSKGFNDWGSYLVSTQALHMSYPVVEEGGGTDVYLYAAILAVAVSVAVAVVLMVKTRRRV